MAVWDDSSISGTVVKKPKDFCICAADILLSPCVCVYVCVNTGICTSWYRTPVIEIRRLNKMAAETMSAF